MMISPGSPEQVVVAFLMGLIDLVSYTKFSPFPGPSLAILEPHDHDYDHHHHHTRNARRPCCFVSPCRPGRRFVFVVLSVSDRARPFPGRLFPQRRTLTHVSCAFVHASYSPPACVADQAFAIKVDLSRFESSSAQTLDLLLCVMVLTPIVFGVFTAIGVATIPILEAC